MESFSGGKEKGRERRPFDPPPKKKFNYASQRFMRRVLSSRDEMFIVFRTVSLLFTLFLFFFLPLLFFFFPFLDIIRWNDG